jgi:hypothetical protein
VNHHLAQVLERVIAVAALRRGPIIGEVATFNGDEPLSPGSAEPRPLRRLMVGRLTLASGTGQWS